MNRSSLVCALVLLATPLMAQPAAQVEPLSDEVTIGLGKTFDHELVAPKAVVLGGKEFLVTWDLNYMRYSGSELIDWGSEISGRKVDLEGQPVGDVLRLESFEDRSDESVHSLAADASGRFTILWHELDGRVGLLMRRFSPNEVRLGTTMLDRVPGFSIGDDLHPAVAMDPSGRLAAAWTRSESGPIRMQLFDATAAPRGAAFATTNSEKQRHPALAMTNGQVILVSERARGASAPAVTVQRFDLAGKQIAVRVQVGGNEGSQVDPAVAANDEARRFVVVWDNGRKIRARVFDASGRKIGPVILVSTESHLEQSFPHVALNAKGSFVVAWQAQENFESPVEVRARFFNHDGEPQGEELVVASGLQVYFDPVSTVALTDDDTFLVAWESVTAPSFRPRIVARLFGVRTP